MGGDCLIRTIYEIKRNRHLDEYYRDNGEEQYIGTKQIVKWAEKAIALKALDMSEYAIMMLRTKSLKCTDANRDEQLAMLVNMAATEAAKGNFQILLDLILAKRVDA